MQFAVNVGEFDGRPADYCYMLMINWLTCTLMALAIGMPVSLLILYFIRINF